MILFIDFSHPILEENSQYTSVKTPKQKWCLQNIVISQILKIFFYFVKLFKILKYYYFSILINLILCTWKSVIKDESLYHVENISWLTSHLLITMWKIDASRHVMLLLQCVERWRMVSRKRKRNTSPPTSKATDCDNTQRPRICSHETRRRKGVT